MKVANSMVHTEDYTRRHLCIGWWSVLCFLTLGIALETMHGFKVQWYLDVGNDTRRLMWTLAHAHGVLIGVLHVAFGLTLRSLPDQTGRWHHVASPCLTGAGVLLPGGFFLGGLIVYGGDPGLGIVLVPAGAALLFVSVLLTAKGATSGEKSTPKANDKARIKSVQRPNRKNR